MSVLTTARERAVNLVAESVYDNPVVTREFRTRMRGWKAYAVMGGYVLFLAAVLFVAYIAKWNDFARGGPGGVYTMSLANQKIGMELFLYLMWTQVILLSLVIPSLTFSAITQEIEKRTIEMLALTRLTPGKIVIGKQLAGFLYSLILLVCSIPLASMCLVFGGVSPAEIGMTYAVLGAWCFLLTCVGVFWSSLYNRTASAALFAYGTTGLYFLITAIYSANFSFVYSRSGGAFQTVPALGALNPGMAPHYILAKASICGVQFLAALAAIALHLAIGSLLLLVASAHVRHLRAERALPVRILLAAITVAVIWLLVGDTSTAGWVRGRYYSDAVSVYPTLILVFLGLGATVFATGRVEARPGQSVAVYALSPWRILKSDLAGGLSFMVVWMALTYGAFGLTTHWAAASQTISLPHSAWRAYFHIGAALIAMIIGISAIGVLASSVVKIRRNAAALVLLYLIAAFAVYGVALAYHVQGVTDTSGPIWQLAAVWPMTPILGSTGEWSGLPKLWWSPKSSWIICSIAYLALAAVCLALAGPAVRRYGGVKEE